MAGSVGDLLDHLTCQDVVSFTGSAATALMLQAHPVIARESVRFIAERDSLNATVLGPDCTSDTPEFELFAKEVVREMTAKAGQKCTAIRRIFVPAAAIGDVERAVSEKLARVVVGDPGVERVTMGALASLRQLADVRAAVAELAREARIVFGDPATPPAAGGAFITPILLRCDDPWNAARGGQARYTDRFAQSQGGLLAAHPAGHSATTPAGRSWMAPTPTGPGGMYTCSTSRPVT